MSADDPLLQPFVLKGLTLRNRVFSSSHEPAYSDGGMPTDRYRLYHVEKAKGGIGMTMTAGSAVVAEDSPPAFGNLHAYRDEIVPWLRRMTEEVHEHGAACMIQLTHLGRRTGWAQDDWLPVVAPSPLREPAHRAIPKEAEDWDIERIVGKYADAAERMQAAGMDGIEIESYGHLFDQFWSPLTNHRTDEYGGSFEHRLRFGWEVLQAIRERVGSDYIVGLRMAVDEHVPGGIDTADRPRDPPPPGGGPADRLRQRHPGHDRQRVGAHPRHPHPRHAVRTPPRLRRPGAGVDRSGRPPRQQGRRRRHRPPRHPRGPGGPGRDDPGPPGRPPPGPQDPRGTRDRDPALRRGDVLPRPHLRRGRGPVHPQRGHQPRGRRCPTTSPGRASPDGSWWSAPGRRGWRRPAWRASEGTASPCWRRCRGPAGRSAWPLATPAAAT